MPFSLPGGFYVNHIALSSELAFTLHDAFRYAGEISSLGLVCPRVIYLFTIRILFFQLAIAATIPGIPEIALRIPENASVRRPLEVRTTVQRVLTVITTIRIANRATVLRMERCKFSSI